MTIPGGKTGRIIAIVAALVLVIRFRNEIAGLLGRVPVVGKLAKAA